MGPDEFCTKTKTKDSQDHPSSNLPVNTPTGPQTAT